MKKILIVLMSLFLLVGCSNNSTKSTEANNESVSNFEMPITRNIDLSRTSLSSFIGKYGCIGDQDFVIIAAYYEEKKNGNKSFTSESVKQFYSDARREKYSNYSDLLKKLAQKGLIMDDPDCEKKIPKPYILTADGLSYAENFQPKEENDKKSV